MGDENEESDETASSEEDEDDSEEDDVMEWDLFSDKLTKHKGNAWNLMRHYGSSLIEKYSLERMDISEVLYLIIQQIGFMPFDYWTNLDANDKALFPQYPLIENIARKGKKIKAV